MAGASRGAAAPAWLKAAPVIFLLLWSGGFAFAKIGLEHAPPMTFLALRYWFALLVLVVVLCVLRPPVPRRAADWGHLIAVGALVQGLYFGLSYFGFWLGVTAGTMALIVSMQPILVGLLAPRLVAERVGLARWIGLVLGLIGAAMVIAARSEIEVTTALGLLCGAGALLAMTAGTLYEKRFGLHHHPVTANTVQYLVGFLLVLPLALSVERMEVNWTADFAVALAYLVIANSLIAVSLLLAMIRHGEAARVSALLFLVPPMAALIAWALIGEAMPPAAWAGMAVAAAGVALATQGVALNYRILMAPRRRIAAAARVVASGLSRTTRRILMQRRTKLFVALGAAGVLGITALADSAFADRKAGHQGMRGHHQGMMANQFRSLAERYDLNQDGNITQDEIDRNRAEWHAEFSGDGDAMTLEQFQDLWLRARNRQMVREFQRFDRDGDGRITLEEYQRPMAQFVENFDRTDDQSISRDDFGRHRDMERGDGDDDSEGATEAQQ